MKAIFKFSLAACLGIAALCPALALAQANDRNEGYLVDQNFKVVTAVGGTVCVRTSEWTPALAATAEAGKRCDPDLQPIPVAQAPKPPAVQAKPAPKPEPAKLLPQKINFSADALFDFDRANLKPDGKAMLDELARDLRGATYDTILVIGHTDRIGTVKYNQKLSVRRAEAVQRYLEGKGIEPARIHAEGKGKSEPVTKPQDCRGKRGAALIKCYQPDRRVDVNVKGTK